MDFDYELETITPDISTILSIGGPGALQLPSGTRTGGSGRPAGATAGAIRWNITDTWLEYFDGSLWSSFSATVLSATGTANQISISGTGGPAYTGAITLSVPNTFIAPGSLQSTTLFGYGSEVISSAGTTQANATVITKAFSNVMSGALLSGVRLPVPSFAGQSHIICNDTGNQIYLYPEIGGIIDTGAVNAPTYIPINSTAGLIWDGTFWSTVRDTTASGNSGIGVSNIQGNVLISNTGVLSLATSTTGLLVNTSSSAQTGALVLSGTLNVANGGTGNTTTTAAFNTLSPLTTAGDTLYFNGTNNVRLPISVTAGQVLTVVAGEPAWADTVNSLITGTTGLLANGVNTAVTGAVTLTGVLSLANGGTQNSLTAIAGGIAWSDSAGIHITAAGTTGQALVSGAGATPTWQDVASTITTSQILKGNGSGAFTANGGTFGGSGSFSGVTLNGTVTNARDAATKEYVDSAGTGLTILSPVQAATVADLTVIGTGPTGPIATFGSLAGGTLYTTGTYYAVPLYNINPGTGGGWATADIVISGGSVTSVTLVTNGNSYTVGDVLSTLPTYLGGTGIGFTINVASTVASWGTVTYTPGTIDLNGGYGIGATLTPAAFGFLSIDAYTLFVGQRVLVKNQTSQIENGIYYVTAIGDNISAKWILTRSTDTNDHIINQLVPGNYCLVENGHANANTSWTETEIGTCTVPGTKIGAIIIGTDNVVYTKFSSTNNYTAGPGLLLTIDQFSNIGVLSITSNTGLSTNVDAIGNVIITNTGITSVTEGAGISISGGAGTSPGPFTGDITITATAASPATKSVSTTYLVLPADYSVFANAASAGFTISLPATGLTDGQIHNIKKVDQTRNIVTISGNGNSIDKYTSIAMNVPFTNMEIQWNSTAAQWYII